MKYSRQRELVREIVINNPVHLSADKIYSMLHSDNPNISLATIYRNLNQLAKEGIIAKITIPSGSDRFDGELEEHYHMICNSCGEIFDSPLEILDSIDQKVREATGFLVESHQLILYGVCEKCCEDKKIN